MEPRCFTLRAFYLPASLIVRTEPQSEIGRNRRKKNTYILLLSLSIEFDSSSAGLRGCYGSCAVAAVAAVVAVLGRLWSDNEDTVVSMRWKFGVYHAWRMLPVDSMAGGISFLFSS